MRRCALRFNYSGYYDSTRCKQINLNKKERKGKCTAKLMYQLLWSVNSVDHQILICMNMPNWNFNKNRDILVNCQYFQQTSKHSFSVNIIELYENGYCIVSPSRVIFVQYAYKFIPWNNLCHPSNLYPWIPPASSLTSSD